MFDDLYQVSYIDTDTNELQIFQGNKDQVEELHRLWKESAEMYNDVRDLKIEKL